ILIPTLFSQAEDGIRDRNVTGVQTCALPIYRHIADLTERAQRDGDAAGEVRGQLLTALIADGADDDMVGIVVRRQFGPAWPDERSEERRVGKEGSTRWGRGAGQEKKEGDSQL